MARRRRRKQSDEWFNLLVLLALLVYAQTRNLWLSIASVLALALGPRLIISAIRNRRLRLSGLGQADNMSGEEFEDFLLAKFKLAGCKGYRTPRTEDYGADLILEKDGERVAVQAKRHGSTVGIEAVQQVIGALRYYGAAKGLVITNSYFTPSAMNLAKSNNVELWDRAKLTRFLLSLSRKQVNETLHEHVATNPVCVRCHSPMVPRKGRRGTFWGCSAFPRCKHALDL